MDQRSSTIAVLQVANGTNTISSSPQMSARMLRLRPWPFFHASKPLTAATLVVLRPGSR